MSLAGFAIGKSEVVRSSLYRVYAAVRNMSLLRAAETPKARKGRTVIAVGSFPPPVHGAATVTDRVAERIGRSGSVVRINLSPGTGASGLRYYTRRFGGVWHGWRQLLKPRGPVTLYVGLDGGIGIVLDLLLVVVGRARRARIVVHHHAFSYLLSQSRLMALVSWCAGRDCIHVALCERMQSLLRTRYGVARCIVVTNAWCCRADPDIFGQRLGGRLRLGHLSNLCHTKGLAEVVAVYEGLRRLGADVSLVLAGPLRCDVAASLLRSLETDRNVRWQGPVEGAGKKHFLQMTDVFLFPSRYIVEADPLVVWEAVLEGRPAVTTMRGCLGEQIVPPLGWAFEEVSFVSEAIGLLAPWAVDPERLGMAQTECFESAKSVFRRSEEQVGELLWMLTAD